MKGHSVYNFELLSSLDENGSLWRRLHQPLPLPLPLLLLLMPFYSQTNFFVQAASLTYFFWRTSFENLKCKVHLDWWLETFRSCSKLENQNFCWKRWKVDDDINKHRYKVLPELRYVGIIEQLVFNLTGLDSVVSVHTNNNILKSCLVKSNPFELKTSHTVILFPYGEYSLAWLSVASLHFPLSENCLKQVSFLDSRIQRHANRTA